MKRKSRENLVLCFDSHPKAGIFEELKPKERTAVYEDLSDQTDYEVSSIRKLLVEMGKVLPRAEMPLDEAKAMANRDRDVYLDRTAGMTYVDLSKKYGLTRGTLEGIVSRVIRAEKPDNEFNKLLSSKWVNREV